MYDLIIIGGGPAGISASLYAVRQNLKFLLITKNLGGLANLVPSLKTYLGFYYITGFDLIERFKEHITQYKVPLKSEHVTLIKRKGKNFAVKTETHTYLTKAIIVATGRRFKKLGIPGEQEFTGKGVSDCTVCDGPLFKNKTVAVIGGGRSGLFGTLFLLKIAKKIYVIEKEEKLKTKGGLKWAADVVKKSENVKIMTGTRAIEIHGNKFVNGIVVQQARKKRVLAVDGVFVEVGYEPNTEFIRNRVRTNGRGEIIIDPECRTSTPGIFAAGDVTHLEEKQVIVAAGEGAKAALSAVLYIEGERAKAVDKRRR